MKRIILLPGFCCILVACGSTGQNATIEDRTLPQNQSEATSVSTTTSSASNVENSHSQYVVKKGDTVYRIALEKGQSYSDIIAWNNLANPHDIKVGQVIRVVPPEVSTSAVASPSSVDIRPLGAVKANELTASSVVTVPSGNNKNGPRVDKRPYSDATYAELQKKELADEALGKVNLISTGKTADKALDSLKTDEILWIWPTEGKVVVNFDDGKNKGVDIAGKLGQNVYAAAAGTVMYAGSGIRGYGNLVIIKHINNFLSAYAHNRMILVKEKQIISKGQIIAEMGDSDSDTVKLHFEIRQQGKPVDPMRFLPIYPSPLKNAE